MNESFNKLIMYHQIHKRSRDGWSKSMISEFFGINWRTASKCLKMSEEAYILLTLSYFSIIGIFKMVSQIIVLSS